MSPPGERNGGVRHTLCRVSETPHPGSKHLIALPDETVARQVATELSDEGFDDVGVEEAGGRWVVRLIDTRLPDAAGGGAYEALRERFAGIAKEHGGAYDEPGDPRPPVS